jgi:Heterokaryon incompatibility protein (HET)
MTIIKAFKERPWEQTSDLDLKIDLGSFESVMVTTTCEVHPQMFRRIFRSSIDNVDNVPIDIDNVRIERFNVACYSWGIFITAHCIGHCLDLFSSRLKFTPVPLRADTPETSRVVDPLWIDRNLFRHWRRHCDSQNKGICHVGRANAQLTHNRPAWLIDTWRLCLTSGDNQAPYVALSYVWGQTTFFKACKANIDQLRIDMALSDSHRRLGVPRTIADAIALVGLLEERYLWVDALCIVQDDHSMKHDQVNNMASIFANATITIIAKDGEHANHGLRGLREISEPRSISQEVFELGNSYSVVHTTPVDPLTRKTSIWNERGWTFQEQLFSRRLLQFHHGSVHWQCACSTFAEIYGKLNIIGDFDDFHQTAPFTELTLNSLPAFPDLDRYVILAAHYNGRKLSYPRDAVRIFLALSLPSRTYTFLEHRTLLSYGLRLT